METKKRREKNGAGGQGENERGTKTLEVERGCLALEILQGGKKASKMKRRSVEERIERGEKKGVEAR